MKLIDAILIGAHTLHGTWKEGYGHLSLLHGETFYAVWNKIWNISALEVKTQETENNVVLRNITTIPKKRHETQTSGFLIRFSPEKTEGVEDTLSPPTLDQIASIPPLLGPGGFKTFLSPLPVRTDTDYKAPVILRSAQPPNHDSKESDSHKQPGRYDFNLLCPLSKVESLA